MDGWRKVRVRTLGGKWVLLKTPFLRVRKGVNQEYTCEKRHQHGTSIYPVLRRIGIVRGSTPRFLAEVNRQITDGPSIYEAKERFESREILLTKKPIWRHVRDFASIALWQRQVAAAQLNHVKVSEPAPLSGKRVVVGLDGGRLRLRINKIGSQQTTTRKYFADKCEPKLFVIYTIDDKGNKVPKGEVFYDGTLQPAAELFTLLKLRLKQLGITQARELVIIGDGASWIWNGVPDLLAALGLESLHVVEIAEEIFYLRCQMKSGRWVPFVKSVLTQWADDMTISLTEAYQVRDTIATAVLASHPPVKVSEGRQEAIAWARQVIETDEALILDTETTGLGTKDEVIQLGIVDLHGALLLDTLVRPTVPVGTEARAIHGITDELLTNAPDFSDLYGSIAHLLSNRPVLAYNAEFDRRLLAQTCAKHRCKSI